MIFDDLQVRYKNRHQIISQSILCFLSCSSDDALFYFAVSFIAFSHLNIPHFGVSLSPNILSEDENSSVFEKLKHFYKCNRLDKTISEKQLIYLIRYFESHFYMISSKASIYEIMKTIDGKTTNLKYESLILSIISSELNHILE